VASKHGMNGLTKTAALEYAEDDIRANAVCPGAIETPMIERFTKGSREQHEQLEQLHPLGRMGTPEEVAQTIYWLCSDAASFVTGHIMPVDGGFTAR
jgi:NAD(P)-dependent dehydrogenase (short-subunit alcohol dehydrogenase family)